MRISGEEILKIGLFCAWQLAGVATFVYLTFFDGYEYNWWNWVVALAVNGILAEIWPIYWFILRPLMG
jgi:hypothetical protein